MTNFIQIGTTAGSRSEAEKISRTLVERRLAACVQILGPITSTYWWEGKIEQSEEFLCLIKTRGDKYSAVETAIKEVHSYKVPEILAVPIAFGSSDYIDWVAKELSEGTR